MTVIYIRNLILRTTESDLKIAILNFVDEKEITRLRKVRDFAFVHFNNRAAACKAMEGINGIKYYFFKLV